MSETVDFGMTYYAHTKKNADGTPAPKCEWEPLYTGPCQNKCAECADLCPNHGHLNKVAYWAAGFAGEMFEECSEEAQTAHEWGFVTGLWHDLGKYSEEFQERLHGKRERADHSTAGAQYLAETYTNPHLSAYPGNQ